MEMSTRKKAVEERGSWSTSLPSITASLELRRRPDLSDWQDVDRHRIHWSIRVPKCASFHPLFDFDSTRCICGPYSDAPEPLPWSKVTNAEPLEVGRSAMVREAVQAGDEFLQALAVGVADSNRRSSKAKVSDTVSYIGLELADVVDAACNFVEARIWPK